MSSLVLVAFANFSFVLRGFNGFHERIAGQKLKLEVLRDSPRIDIPMYKSLSLKGPLMLE